MKDNLTGSTLRSNGTARSQLSHRVPDLHPSRTQLVGWKVAHAGGSQMFVRVPGSSPEGRSPPPLCYFHLSGTGCVCSRVEDNISVKSSC